MTVSLEPAQAWRPLAPDQWDADTARHLLQRAGWAARPEEIERAVTDGLSATLDRLFPAEPRVLPEPDLVREFSAAAAVLRREARKAEPQEKRRLQKDIRELGRTAVQDLSMKWLAFAADPAHAATSKWVLFLSDVYVISAEKVKNPSHVFQHFDALGRHGFGPAPALTKAISRSPAMVNYLDANESRRDAPNENFARELFELFVLGEGNYTETDIKEAARAFTGYRLGGPDGGFRFDRRQHDATAKTVFGKTGAFGGDDVVDIAYAQPAAARFLPAELARFYLSEHALPLAQLDELGRQWRQAGFDLRWLARSFFGSQLFYAPEYRGQFIKSPVQFYLGLLHHLELDPAPLPRLTLNALRQMGQLPFYPPNVRGWVGGRTWISASALLARRQLVETLFAGISEKDLNADEVAALSRARDRGRTRFAVPSETLKEIDALPAPAAASRLIELFLNPASPTATQLQPLLADFIGQAARDSRAGARPARRAAAALLQSPEYQLC